MKMSRPLLLPTTLMAFGFLSLFSHVVFADDYVLTLKDHVFAPADLIIPANQKVKLIVRNEQSVPAEFESSDLDREKIVTPGSEITVFIGPLSAGNYGYFDDFHRETTGTLVAK